MLRFLTTMRLGVTQPSALHIRLNSYARQHPLYKALKDLGRLYRIIFCASR
ncbi:Tn3 family transposase [Spirosoma soli]|uniref:Tn3 family transposase n=1 Tax=Spirosoma soli TaxID=1770529 RepID=A0ABW5MCL7_9BACT